MKKMTAAILLFDLMAGLLFLSLHGLQSRTVASDSRMIMDAEESFDADEVRKIAITFDDGPPPQLHCTAFGWAEGAGDTCNLFRHR